MMRLKYVVKTLFNILHFDFQITVHMVHLSGLNYIIMTLKALLSLHRRIAIRQHAGKKEHRADLVMMAMGKNWCLEQKWISILEKFILNVVMHLQTITILWCLRWVGVIRIFKQHSYLDW